MYNFKEARTRRGLLVQMYREMKRTHEDNGTWSWWLLGQIEELDYEIAEAHQLVHAQIAPARDKGYPVMRFENLSIPIVSQWSTSINEGVAADVQ